MSNNKEQASFVQKLWNLLTSVKLTFALLLILAVISVAGTLIPQNQPAQAYVNGYGQGLGNLILGFGLYDAYHTAWFRLVMALLAVNLVVCSLERWPLTMRMVRVDPDRELEKSRKAVESFTLAGGPAEHKGPVGQALQRAVGRVYFIEDQGGVKLFAHKGAWTRLAVYAVHLSVLIIFAGALVGNIWGFSGDMRILEGQAVDHIQTRDGKRLPLGFDVRLDKFTVSFYKNQRGMPSEYRSDLVFLRGGREIKRHALRVNHPAQVDGIDFYQASYGQVADPVKVRVTAPGGKLAELDLRHHDWTELPMGGKAGVFEYRPRVAMGKVYDGPMARILYQPPGGEARMLSAFKAGAKLRMGGGGGIKFEVISAVSKNYSGISVKYDPGVWLIWVGCTLMVVGFFFTFYTAHKKVWVRLSPTGPGRTRVEMAYQANKGRGAARRLVAKLAAGLGANQDKGE